MVEPHKENMKKNKITKKQIIILLGIALIILSMIYYKLSQKALVPEVGDQIKYLKEKIDNLNIPGVKKAEPAPVALAATNPAATDSKDKGQKNPTFSNIPPINPINQNLVDNSPQISKASSEKNYEPAALADIESLNKIIQLLEDKISRLEGDLNKPDYNKNKKLMFVSIAYKLLLALNSSAPYKSQLDLLLFVNTDPELTPNLKEILTYGEQGVKNSSILAWEFRNIIYKDIFLANINNSKGLSSRIKYYFYKMLFIKNTNNKLSETSLMYQLNQIQSYLDNNSLLEASELLTTLQDSFTTKNRLWFEELQRRIKIQEVCNLLNHQLNSYLNIRNQ
ncbi:hypothetical protein ABSA28_00267 [Candidatus Hepatincolaceae symbiont of Richtersius coronifer]